MDEWMRTDSTIQMSKEPFDNPNGKKLRSMLTKTDFLKQAKSTKKSGRKNDLGDLTVKLMGLPKISNLMSNASPSTIKSMKQLQQLKQVPLPKSRFPSVQQAIEDHITLNPQDEVHHGRKGYSDFKQMYPEVFPDNFKEKDWRSTLQSAYSHAGRYGA